MSKVLVDSSVWIAFFKGADSAKPLFDLLDSNQICTNDLILSELVPSLKHRNEMDLIELLYSIERIRIEIDWATIIQMQTINLENGINRVGIPDLIVAQNAIQNQLRLLSFDKHFELMKQFIELETMDSN
jgi:predicted nucleic acid-binding protein